MNLGKNFTYHELVRSETGSRLGIPNVPNERQIENARYLTRTILQPLRNSKGRININSWYRSPELCESIGSSKNSYHTTGGAADIESDTISNYDLFVYIAETFEFDELILEYVNKQDPRAGWVHVAALPGSNRKLIKIKDNNHNYKVVTLEYVKQYYSEL